jgi:hypothetical protein
MSESDKREPARPVGDGRVRAALRGQLALAALSGKEGAIFNAAIAAAVQDRLAGSHYGETLAARGITTVAFGDDGHLSNTEPTERQTPSSLCSD